MCSHAVSCAEINVALFCMQKFRYEPRGVRRPRREEGPMGACVPRRQAMGAIWRGPFGWVLNPVATSAACLRLSCRSSPLFLVTLPQGLCTFLNGLSSLLVPLLSLTILNKLPYPPLRIQCAPRPSSLSRLSLSHCLTSLLPTTIAATPVVTAISLVTRWMRGIQRCCRRDMIMRGLPSMMLACEWSAIFYVVQRAER